jgi:uncharacterized protein (TIGR02757 family)
MGSAFYNRVLRSSVLRERLESLYRHYDHRFVDPDPLELVRRQTSDADREVVGLLASGLAFGTVRQIKASITRVLDVLGASPAAAVARLEPAVAARQLAGMKHRWTEGRDVACLLWMIRQMRERAGSVEAFFLEGHDPAAADVERALTSFSERALALDAGGLYGRGPLPAKAGVRYFFPSPRTGSACKRLNLYLRWMVRREGVDLGVWKGVDAAALVIPLDAHIYAIARRVRLTRYKSPGWKMAMDITRRLRRFDPRDPVKYDFAFHRLGLWRKDDEIRALRGARRTSAR